MLKLALALHQPFVDHRVRLTLQFIALAVQPALDDAQAVLADSRRPFDYATVQSRDFLCRDHGLAQQQTQRVLLARWKIRYDRNRFV